MLRPIVMAAVAAAVLLVSPTSHAQFAKPEDAVKYRQSVFTVMGRSMGGLNAVVRGDRPYNAAEVQRNAEIIAMMAGLPWTAFGPGTESPKALPAIWKEGDKFKKAQDGLQDAAAKLVAASKTGKVEDLRGAFGNVGASCKACHDDFRGK
ncbi:c-type cytochrome [Piscinibacterium candidicorallinum]|jgi:cytochrome c556|uniref:C-type cytochrome n=1 Tax=Piscinibacterium candidicorallinum TaxID=1793872 RepID=A0ABV7H0S5_9BURK